MREESCPQLALRSRNKALNCLLRGKSDLAFAHFLVALTLCPTWKEALKPQFLNALYEWCESLSNQQRYNDVFTCYEQALKLFPENSDILNSLGSHLYRWGHIREAFNHFHRALTCDPLCLKARRNLQGTSNLLLERWHFRMLNDKVRNEAFQTAVRKRISQMINHSTPYVLDIGTGTGLLSLFAQDAGAKQVFACDYSETMIKLAAEVLESNNSTEGISLINKKSTELAIPTDIPERVPLVVTEIVDAGLFGEGILQTLSDAWERLLMPEGRVVPQACTLWIVPIECDYIASKYQMRQTQEGKIVFLNIQKQNLIFESEEPYDTEDLDSVPGVFRLLAEPYSAFNINFCDPKEIQAWLQEGHEIKHRIKCSRSGKLQALVAWFDLHLDDDITISSAPIDHVNHCNVVNQKAKCWDQAVFPEKFPISVTSGSVLTVILSCSNGKLCIKTDVDNNVIDTSIDCNETLLSAKASESFDGPAKQKCTGPKLQESIGAEKHSVNESKTLKLTPSELQTVRVSQEGIKFLNDSIWMQGLEEAAVHICEKANIAGFKYILDLSPLPLIGMFLLTQMSSSAQLLYTTNEEAAEMIAKCNNLKKAQLKCLSEDQLLEVIANENIKFDVIVVHVIDQTGELKENMFTTIPILKESLAENGIFLPHCLSIVGQLVKSDWLAHVSHVEGSDSTCGYTVAPFINIYQSNHHLDLNLATLPAVQLCESMQLLCLEPIDAGPIHQDITMKSLQSGEVNALVYWFNIQYLPLCKSLSTYHQGSFVNQAAILLTPVISAVQGHDVKLHIAFEKGFFHVMSAQDTRTSS